MVSSTQAVLQPLGASQVSDQAGPPDFVGSMCACWGASQRQQKGHERNGMLPGEVDGSRSLWAVF